MTEIRALTPNSEMRTSQTTGYANVADTDDDDDDDDDDDNDDTTHYEKEINHISRRNHRLSSAPPSSSGTPTKRVQSRSMAKAQK